MKRSRGEGKSSAGDAGGEGQTEPDGGVKQFTWAVREVGGVRHVASTRQASVISPAPGLLGLTDHQWDFIY